MFLPGMPKFVVVYFLFATILFLPWKIIPISDNSSFLTRRPDLPGYHLPITFSANAFHHTFFLVSVAISTCYSQDDNKYTTCPRNFSCGQHFQEVSYPFWRDDHPQYCGHPSFELKCQNNEYPTIEINNRTFHVRELNQFNHIIYYRKLGPLGHLLSSGVA